MIYRLWVYTCTHSAVHGHLLCTCCASLDWQCICCVKLHWECICCAPPHCQFTCCAPSHWQFTCCAPSHWSAKHHHTDQLSPSHWQCCCTTTPTVHLLCTTTLTVHLQWPCWLFTLSLQTDFMSSSSHSCRRMTRWKEARTFSTMRSTCNRYGQTLQCKFFSAIIGNWPTFLVP